jgi:glucosyl-3-phosphoglycerate synthase
MTVGLVAPRVPLCHQDFDPDLLAEARWASGVTTSVCLPARNEAPTVGSIVEVIIRDLVDRRGLVDEVIVLDDGSTDATSRVASDAGAQVVAVGDILPEFGPASGKGNVLWKSLFVSHGDLICWVDADVDNFDHRFVTGLLGPLLTNDEVALVKGFYRRPGPGPVHGGGRVTELVARPLISALFPELATIVQPLAGATAARREVLEVLPFAEGWGVELALLIDVATRFGLDRVAQVDLGTILHDNQTLRDLGPQAMAVLTAGLRRAGHDLSTGASRELLRFDLDHRQEVEDVPVGERPPMLSVPMYRVLFPDVLTA